MKKGETPGADDVDDDDEEEELARASRRSNITLANKARKSIKQDDYETPGEGPLKETDEGYEMTRG
jgi:hypothetical protein